MSVCNFLFGGRPSNPMRLRAIAATATASAAFAVHSRRAKAQNVVPANSGAAAPQSFWHQATTVPPFDLHASRYDMSTYGGRLLHFFDLIGDLTTLTTTAAQLERHRQTLRDVATAETPPTDAELWRARQVIGAVTHPETGEMISAFRCGLLVLCFAPANLFICVGGC